MENNLSISFERNLYRAVIRFKADHPGALEARTKQRKGWRATDEGGFDRSAIREVDRYRTDRAEPVPGDLVAMKM
jgi:hypothetical protein